MGRDSPSAGRRHHSRSRSRSRSRSGSRGRSTHRRDRDRSHEARSRDRSRERRSKSRSRSRERRSRHNKSRSRSRSHGRSDRRDTLSARGAIHNDDGWDEQTLKQKLPQKRENQGQGEAPADKSSVEYQMWAMGLPVGFGSTKESSVEGNVGTYVAPKLTKREYRQYMNRRGGSIRPLDNECGRAPRDHARQKTCK